MTGSGRRVGDRVYFANGSWANYCSLEWWETASTGMDRYGCLVYATIDGDRVRVQHGENPEAVRWFTLDELNHVGGEWTDGMPDQRWFDEIHRRMGAD